MINEAKRVYNGFGQMTAEYQEHSGTVNTSTSLKTQYTYDTAANGSRMTGMIYPDGGTITYSYGASNQLNDVISRLDAMKQGTLTLESYKFLGTSIVVERDHPQDGVNLTYIKLSGESNGDAGDKYTGLDRFGRVIDQRWVSGTTNVDRYTYTYDRDSNVLTKINTNHTANNMTYTYDGLNRLVSADRASVIVTDQTWSLDALGNMTLVTGDSPDYRAYNDQNELTGSGGGPSADTFSYAYDDAGNLLNDAQGNHFTYDAWNRLVAWQDIWHLGTGSE